MALSADGGEAARFANAWYANDHRGIGNSLGYPDCCTDFFTRYWSDLGWLDPTWPMACNSVDPNAADEIANELNFESTPEGNILLRWIGIRPVFHLPCALGCEQTHVLSRTHWNTLEAIGADQEVRWCRELLDSPVEWSALHGIAEVRTPLLKVATRTEPSSHKFTVRIHGNSYPEHGADALVFPYRSSAIQSTRQIELLHRDNGFMSPTAMTDAHGDLIKACKETAKPGDLIVDLGCGNGELLRRLRDECDLDVLGIEKDRAKVARGRGLVLRDRHALVHGDLFDVEAWRPSNHGDCVILVSSARLSEYPDQALKLFRAFGDSRAKFLVYSYNDQDVKSTLAAIASVTGMSIGHTGVEGIVVAHL